MDSSQGVGLRNLAIERLLSGHYIESGDNLIILIRKYDRGDPDAVDGETYEKITFAIKNYEEGKPMAVNSPDVRFYYSSGTSAFISRGAGVFSSEASGIIVIEKKSPNRLRIRLDVVLLAKPASEGPALWPLFSVARSANQERRAS